MLSRSFTSREQWIMVGLSAAIVTGAAVIVLQRDGGERAGEQEPVPLLEPSPAAHAAEPDPAPQPEPAPEAPPVVMEEPAESPKVTVAVRGAVKYPGLYELAGDRRVDDLIERAGGLAEGADMRDINIAAPLLDGSTLTVPSFPDSETGAYGGQAYPLHATLNPPQYTVSGWRQGSAGGAGADSGTADGGGAAGGLIDLNRASQSELETLPGIGPVTAASIISYREQMPFQSVEELEQVSGIGPKRLEAVRDMVTVTR